MPGFRGHESEHRAGSVLGCLLKPIWLGGCKHSVQWATGAGTSAWLKASLKAPKAKTAEEGSVFSLFLCCLCERLMQSSEHCHHCTPQAATSASGRDEHIRWDAEGPHLSIFCLSFCFCFFFNDELTEFSSRLIFLSVYLVSVFLALSSLCKYPLSPSLPFTWYIPQQPQ